jgi:SAM-dependent methyltransferase
MAHPARAVPSAPAAAGCPACGRGRARLVREVTSAEAAQHFVLAEAEPERHTALRRYVEGLWAGDRCRLLACDGCGLIRADPLVAGDAVFYALAYRRTRYPALKWEHRVTGRALEARSPGARSLLELGAGDGAFLRSVVPARFRPEEVLATEYSDYGRRAVEALGVRCLPLDARALPRDLDGRFDVVCLFQVLEHLDGLDELFERIGRLARRRATLFVAVPSAARVALHEAHGALLDMPPNHLTRWTAGALEALGARHGWRLAEHRVEPEAYLPAARRLLEYRHLRAAQRPGSVPNRVRRLPPSAARRALDAAWLLATLPAALPALRALRRAGGGDSQWARLERGG